MDKRKAILEAALNLFVEYGFHGTATAKIASRAEVANGTLFNYFNSKDELIVTLYQEILKDREEELLNSIPSHSLVKESFAALFEVSLDWMLQNKLRYQYLRQFKQSPYYKPFIGAEQGHPLFVLIQNGIDIVLLKPMPSQLLFGIFSGHLDALFDYISSNELGQDRSLSLVRECFEIVWDTLKD